MALVVIIEDGTGVTDANSYVTLAEARTYAAMRGVTLPADDDECAVLLFKATDYLESKAALYAGTKTIAGDSLEWPRMGAYILGYDGSDDAETPYPDSLIPSNLKKAQCAAVIALSQGVDLLASRLPSDLVIEETVGPITTKYADPTNVEAIFTAIDAWLLPLFGGRLQMALFTTRV